MSAGPDLHDVVEGGEAVGQRGEGGGDEEDTPPAAPDPVVAAVAVAVGVAVAWAEDREHDGSRAAGGPGRGRGRMRGVGEGGAEAEAETAAATEARVGVGVGERLPQGRYWVGLFGFFAGVAGLMLLAALVRGDPADDPGPMAVLFVAMAVITASMARVTVDVTPGALVVRNLVWKRQLHWDRIVGFRVKPYRFSKFSAASVVACTEAGLEIRIWATMTRSRRRAAEIAAAFEDLAKDHGIPADLDPVKLRCRWL